MDAGSTKVSRTVLDDLVYLTEEHIEKKAVQDRPALAGKILNALGVDSISQAGDYEPVLRAVMNGAADDARRQAYAVSRPVAAPDEHPAFQAAAAAELLGLSGEDDADYLELQDDYCRHKSRTWDAAQSYEETHKGPSKVRRLRAAIWIKQGGRTAYDNRRELLKSFESIIDARLENLPEEDRAQLKAAADAASNVVESVVHEPSVQRSPTTGHKLLPSVKALTRARVTWSPILSTLTLALGPVLVSYVIIPLFPRPINQPLRSLSEVVLSGASLILTALPAGYLAFAIWRKTLHRHQVKWITSALLMPLIAYATVIYGNYFTLTADAREIRQQAASEWKTIISANFDSRNPCQHDDPGGTDCEEAMGTMRLVGTSGQMGTPVPPEGELQSFAGDFYAEVRYRPREGTSWDNCVIDVQALQSTLYPRDFGLARLNGDPAGRYAATVTRAGVNDQSLAMAAMDAHPLPFIGVRAVPGWDDTSWTTLGVARIGSEYKFFVNDRLVLSDVVSDAQHDTEVQLGLKSNSPEQVVRCEFDYFKLWAKVG